MIFKCKVINPETGEVVHENGLLLAWVGLAEGVAAVVGAPTGKCDTFPPDWIWLGAPVQFAPSLHL